MTHDLLSDYQYDLPQELIAQQPAQPRDHSRLLVYDRASGTMTDAHFYELATFLPPASTLVLNNSKVEKARMRFGNIEIFEVERINSRTMEALVRPGRKFREGSIVRLDGGVEAQVVRVHDDGLRTLVLNVDLDDPVLDRQTPFPPYIEADETLAPLYQTVYARDEGSKAAPTAGLHFTEGLMQKVEATGHQFVEVTLHVGLGTFAPVKTERISEHKMHSEHFVLGTGPADLLNRATCRVAVGTTSVRVLESALGADGRYAPSSGSTDIFITPGYRFRAVDALVTNFHLPGSTLLMLVSAFAGYEATRKLYAHAVAERYRFFSFGDAMLIL